MIPKWKITKTETLNENPHGGYYVHRFEVEGGEKGDYYFHKNNNAVSAFVMKEDGVFVMLHEYRLLFDRMTLSQVQGGIDKGEVSEEAIAREIIEEVGYKANVITKIGEIASVPAFSTEMVHAYLAEDLEPKEKHSGPFEYTEPVEMTTDEIDAAIASGEIWDGNVIAPWYLVKQYLEKRKNNK